MFATLAINKNSLKKTLITTVPSIVHLENACKENSSLLLLCFLFSKLKFSNKKFDKKFGKLLDICAFLV